MKVIAIKSTKKIIKGFTYEVINLHNDGKNNRWLEGIVEIKNIGRFTVNNFTTEDKKPLPKINIVTPKEEVKILQYGDLKKGDILICKSDSYKTLVKDGMYKIEDLITRSSQRTGWNGSTSTYSEHFIKFEGVSRKLIFSNWRFNKLPSDQAREMVLNQVLYDEDDNVVRTDFKAVRKIEFVKNKELELMKVLSKSMLDENRHHLDMIDWGCQQICKNMNITKVDYTKLLSMTLQDILNLIETKEE
jgi:hypothetical protein